MNLQPAWNRSWTRWGMIFSILSVALGAQAQTNSEDLSLFGTVGQGVATVKNAQIVGPNACAPTAVANGLTFLQNYSIDTGQGNPFTVAQGGISTQAGVNALATDMKTEDNNVTYYTNLANGKVYVHDNLNNPPRQGSFTRINIGGGVMIRVKVGPTIMNEGGTSPDNIYAGTKTYVGSVSTGTPAVSFGQGFDPTAAVLASQLKVDDAVEVGVTWGTNKTGGGFVATGGAHFLTLTSISINTLTGKGTVGLIDPWGATQAGFLPGDTANYVTANATIQGNLIFISGNFGDDADTFGRGFLYGAGGQNASGIITLEDFQSIPALIQGLPVPEPSTYLAGIMVLVPLGVSSLRKLRAARLLG